jgi:hypothetical protein
MTNLSANLQSPLAGDLGGAGSGKLISISFLRLIMNSPSPADGEGVRG